MCKKYFLTLMSFFIFFTIIKLQKNKKIEYSGNKHKN